METGVSVLEQVQTAFGCAGPDVRTYSPLALAYMGDAEIGRASCRERV